MSKKPLSKDVQARIDALIKEEREKWEKEKLEAQIKEAEEFIDVLEQSIKDFEKKVEKEMQNNRREIGLKHYDRFVMMVFQEILKGATKVELMHLLPSIFGIPEFQLPKA